MIHPIRFRNPPPDFGFGFSVRDVDGMNHETLRMAMALTMAGINGSYSKSQWKLAAKSTEKAEKKRLGSANRLRMLRRGAVISS